ncbi:phage tail protein [Leminorella grimontii]|uniref:phage tail protein n=1 Tax=Leminorella grimontii TaxID=82981 RepID=UPI00321FE4B4
MKSLKEQLLTPGNTAESVHILGADVFIRRKTAQELIDYDRESALIRDKKDAEGQSVFSVNFILSALVDENGAQIPAEDLPTAAEVLAVHDNVALMDALVKVQKHSVGTLEEAEKNSSPRRG